MFGLPGSEPFQEIYEAKSRSLRDNKWPVWGAYTIRDREIVPAENAKLKTRYIPAGRLELPGEFAKLSGDPSEEVMLDFVNRYGLLGYSFAQVGTALEAVGAVKLGFKVLDPEQGDPIEWISWHAVGVHLVMSMIEALNSDDPRELELLLATFRKIDPRNGKPIIRYRFGIRGLPVSATADLILFKGQDEAYVELEPGCRAVLDDPRSIALTMITEILNANLEGIPRRLELESKPDGKGLEIKSLFRPNSLLDSIYWLLSDAVVSGRIRTCEECGSPFVADSDRRKFCPPIDGPGSVSRCMNSNKVKRHRDRKKA